MNKLNGHDNLLSLGLAAHEANLLVEAENFYSQYLKNHPHDDHALDLLGILYAEQGKFEKARDCFIAASSLVPDNARYLNHLGNALQHSGKISHAIEKFQAALTINPSYAEAHNNLANVYLKQKDLDKAISHYQQAIALMPHYIDARNNLALAFLTIQAVDKAALQFLQVLAGDKTNLLAHHHLGNIAYENNDYAVAHHHFESVLTQNPTHVPTLLNRGALYLKQHDSSGALTSFLNVLSIEPENRIALSNLAAVYFTIKKFEEAVRYYYDLLVLEPNDLTAHFNLAVIYMQQQKYQQAKIHLEQLLNVAPQDINAQTNYAIVLLKLKNKALAIQHFNRVLTLDPENLSVQYTLNALTGNTLPDKAPRDYIRNLFDHYAEHFDEELIHKLHYHTPKLLKAAIAPYLKKHASIMLDLGCGTGLAGAALKEYAQQLIGIDLSPNMIEICRAKNLYDQLITDDLLAGMQGLPGLMDVIIAADVLVYFGTLEPVFLQVYQHLQWQGYFIFSVEKGKDYPYQLQETGRFTHHVAYLHTLFDRFDVLLEKEVILRQQGDEAAIGMIYVLRKR